MGIERPQSSTEKSEYRSISAKTPRDVFLAELALVGQECLKAHTPIDEQCAKADYNEEILALERESERVYGYIAPEFVNKLKFDNLKKYADIKRFDIIGSDEEVEMVNINGVRSSVKTGYTVKFRCKERDHGISVFMDTDTYEKFMSKKKVDNAPKVD